MAQIIENKHNSTLLHAYDLQINAAKQGFDWAHPAPILEKLVEETAEFIEAAGEESAANMQDEFGDLLFTLINIGRSYKINPERALQHANQKFSTRFTMMQTLATEKGQVFAELNLKQQEELWVKAKERLSQYFCKSI